MPRTPRAGSREVTSGLVASPIVSTIASGSRSSTPASISRWTAKYGARSSFIAMATARPPANGEAGEPQLKRVHLRVASPRSGMPRTPRSQDLPASPAVTGEGVPIVSTIASEPHPLTPSPLQSNGEGGPEGMRPILTGHPVRLPQTPLSRAPSPSSRWRGGQGVRSGRPLPRSPSPPFRWRGGQGVRFRSPLPGERVRVRGAAANSGAAAPGRPSRAPASRGRR